MEFLIGLGLGLMPLVALLLIPGRPIKQQILIIRGKNSWVATLPANLTVGEMHRFWESVHHALKGESAWLILPKGGKIERGEDVDILKPPIITSPEFPISDRIANSLRAQSDSSPPKN